MSLWVDPAQAREAIATGDGRQVRIALLDSGVEIGHPDFLGRALADDLVIDLQSEISCQPGTGEDRYGHGTALAGLIWELAPAAQIGSFRVLGADLRAQTVAIAVAAREAIARGYQILNCSFACTLPGHLALYKEWTDLAALDGIHVVAAGSSRERRHPEWPADFTSVLGVDCHEGPLDPLGIIHRKGQLVEFEARGADLLVPWSNGSHRMMTGSSFAAASLTGLLARLLSRQAVTDIHLVKALLRQLAAS